MRNYLNLVFLILLSSCGKDNASTNSTTCVNTNLQSGTSSFSVRLYPNISDFKLYESKGVNTEAHSAPVDNTHTGYNISGEIVNGNDIKTMSISFILPNNANTINGNIIGDFGWTNNNPGLRPILVLTPPRYETGAMHGGTLTITCLKSNTIKGTFSGSFTSSTNGSFLNFDQGSFEAKF